MRELKIVSGDKSCEKVLKKHALNCSGKTYKNDSQKVKKCEIWENERESCILRNIEKKGKI